MHNKNYIRWHEILNFWMSDLKHVQCGFYIMWRHNQFFAVRISRFSRVVVKVSPPERVKVTRGD